MSLVYGHAAIAQIGQLVHDQAVAGGRAQRVHDVYFSLRELFRRYLGGAAGGIYGAGYAGGQAHVHNVLALLQKLCKIVHIFGNVDLGGQSFRAPAHCVVEVRKRYRLPQIVVIIFPVEAVMEADVMDIPCLKMLLCQIRCGAAAENVIAHKMGLLVFYPPGQVKSGAVLSQCFGV